MQTELVISVRVFISFSLDQNYLRLFLCLS